MLAVTRKDYVSGLFDIPQKQPKIEESHDGIHVTKKGHLEVWPNLGWAGPA